MSIMAFLEYQEEDPAIKEILLLRHALHYLPSGPTPEQLQMYFDSFDKIALFKWHLRTRFLPLLYNLKADQCTQESKKNPEFPEMAIDGLIDLCKRMHALVGSGVTEKYLEEQFLKWGDIFTPAVVAHFVTLINHEVLQFAHIAQRISLCDLQKNVDHYRPTYNALLENLGGLARKKESEGGGAETLT